MLQSIETLEDGSIIGFWLIEETEDELITLLGNRSDLLDAMASFSSEKRRLEFVATRVLLKNMLKEEKTIAYTPDGYPFLTDNSYNISISHTGKNVGIILNKYRKVGIDIEKISDKIVNNIKIDSINQICISPFIPYIEGTMEVQETYTDQKSEFVVNYRVEPSVCKVWTVK